MRPIILITICAIAISATGEVVTFPLEYNRNDFVVIDSDFVKVYLVNGVVSGESGSPQITSEPLHILLPPDAKLLSATIRSAIWGTLAHGVPFPAQPPSILSAGSPGTVAPDSGLYLRNRYFPESPVLSASQGNLAGYNLAGVCVAPVRWNPFEKKCEYLISGELAVEFDRGHWAPKAPARRSPIGDGIWRSAVSSLVLNEAELNSYTINIDPDAYDWAIFGPSGFTAGLQNLSWFRKSWALKDTVVALEDVYTAFPGADNAEKLRNAIDYFYTTYGISYVVILGDAGVAPDRTVFAMDCEAGFYDNENEIRADLYFADLDGDWNFDSDTVFGEVADSVDIYPDVFIGRFSVEHLSQLSGFVSKIETYESIPGGTFPGSGLMLGQILWDDPITDGGEFKDDLIENVFPDYFTFGKVYARDGGRKEDAVDSLDTGPNIVNHAGHASFSVICIDHGSCILPSDMAGLTNTARPSVMFSIGCWPAAFDTNCIAERFVNNNDGGGVAFIGNSRYGWGSPGNPGQGYSEVLDRALCEEIFSGNEQLGAALAIAKARYAPYARWANVWRWVIFQLNLLGDPATAAITGYSPIEITYEIEGSNIGVTATTSTSAPANGAIVAAFDNYGLVDRAIADDAGFASLNIEAATIPVFITARFGSEGFAAETLFTPAGDGFFHYWYAPTFGYSDYSAEPGDTVETVFSIGDFDSDLTGITWAPTTIYGGAIWTTDPPTSIFSGDSAVFSAAFIIPSGIRPDTTLVVEPNLSYSGGDIGFPASFSINCPVLQLAGGLLGDSDSSLEPGEIAQLWVLWENTGDGGTQGETADVSCPGGELDISGYPVTVPFTRPGDTAYVGPFDVSWASGEDPKPIVPLFVSAGEYTDTLYLATVSLGFSHDAETSDDPFTLGSPAHLWHRSTRRPYNGSYSWWCGDNFSGGYLPSCDDYITTDPMVLGANAELSFMAYLAFPNYGSDGLYIEILGTDESDTTELDFLGSGGALLSFIVGWSEYRYNLDDVPYSPGDTIRIRFRFLSDLEDEDEGVFIDDIELTQTETYFTTGITEYPVKPERFTISAYPNPFNSAVNIRVSGLGSWVSDIQIFDINGRRIAEIPIYRSESVKPSSTTAPGVCRWTPDESLGSGIYLLRTKGTNASIKIVYLK